MSRELLEKAAKAAGLIVQKNTEVVNADDRFIGIKVRDTERDKYRLWNPLTDDGDAFRLAVKLRIGLDHNRAGDQQRYVAAERPGCEGCFSPVCAIEDEFEDESHRAAATRLAIVRAAAAIGEAK